MGLLDKFFGRAEGRLDDVHLHLSKIDLARFRAISKRYHDSDPEPGCSKYLDLQRWLTTALAHYRMLGLAERARLAILDIGTGAGYFPFVCRNAGHEVLAIDVPDHDFYREMTDLLEVRRLEHLIEPFQALPSLGQRFEVITAFAICFNGHATDRLWGPEEWAFFIDDLRTNVAHSDATLFLKFNAEPDGKPISDELLEYFLGLDAVIDGAKIRFQF